MSAVAFAMHPLRVESVAWASERRDVMSGFFAVWTIWAYVEAAEAKARNGKRSLWLAASLTAFLVSLACKATGMCLPVVLSVLDFYPLRRLSWSRAGVASGRAGWVWLEKFPFWLAGVAGAGTALYGQRVAGALTAIETWTACDRLAFACFGVVFYVRKTIAPFGLSPLYEIAPDFSPLQLRFVASAAAAIGLTVAVLRWSRRWPALPAAWLSYLVLLAPVSGLAQAAGKWQPIATATCRA